MNSEITVFGKHTSVRTTGRASTDVLALGLPDTVAPAVGKETDIRTRQKGWIDNGRHNLFPEFCRALADNVAPLNSCVEMAARYLAGHGMEFLDRDGNPIEEARDVWHNRILSHTSEEEFLYATALDIALMGSFSWLNMPSQAFATERLVHLDVTRTRMGPKNEINLVDRYFWSANWEEVNRRNRKFDPKDYPAYGLKRGEASVLYRRFYKQTRDYYGEPWWLPAIADSEVMARIPVFNRTQIDTGFRPAFHIHVIDSRDQIDLEQIDESIEAVFTGSDGKTYMVTHGKTRETAPVITKLERGDHAGELEMVGESTEERIYRAYGIPKILMGIDTKTGMQGQGLASEQVVTMFERTFIAPKQQLITSAVSRIMRDNGVDVWDARIKPLKPFDEASDQVLQRMVYLRSRTVREVREEDGLEPLGDDRDGKLLIEVSSAGTNDTAPANA